MIEDSVFAKGLSMSIQKTSSLININNLNDKEFAVLEYLSEAEALTTSAVSNLLCVNRAVSKRILERLFNARLINKIKVTTTNRSMFTLYLATNTKFPDNPSNACRFAVLGMFFSQGKKQIPGFEWRIWRNKNGLIFSKMFFDGTDEDDCEWTIDVPRRGEKIYDNFQLYILPTIKEAQSRLDKGDRYTTDLHLLKKDEKLLKQKIFEKI